MKKNTFSLSGQCTVTSGEWNSFADSFQNFERFTKIKGESAFMRTENLSTDMVGAVESSLYCMYESYLSKRWVSLSA